MTRAFDSIAAFLLGATLGIVLALSLSGEVIVYGDAPVTAPQLGSRDFVPLSQFEAIRSAGPSSVAQPTPTLHQPRTLSPAASAPATVAPSASSVPTPTPVRIPATTERAASKAGTLRGVGTWYAYVPGQAAAGPALRAALGPKWRFRSVSVCVTDGGAMACVHVVLSDWCACADRPGGPTLVDLDWRSFRQLMPLSRGVITIEVLP